MTANFMSAGEALRAIHKGELTAQELVKDCLGRIAEHEGIVGAWAHLDPDYALQQARLADETRQRGHPLGLLHGIPVGIEDVIDTAGVPTELGTPLYAGREPAGDAAVVERLREAGAIMLGKTVTTELAVHAPGKTTNPHDPQRTPGGSSSGSAAAVASFMVPLAIGTQTDGSVIATASYCGVFGFKPTFGRISRYRVLTRSSVLDTMGVLARTLEDISLVSDVLMAYDSRDQSMQMRARPRVFEIMGQQPPMEPHFALVRSPVWDQAEESTKDALRELIAAIEEHVDLVELPPGFRDAHEVHRVIMEADLARHFAKEYRDGKDRLSAALCQTIERGQKILAVDYNHAVGRIAQYRQDLAEIFYEYDAIMTPAAPGEAPVGLNSIGSAVFCCIWTLCGLPALSVPLLQGPADLPIGVQLVGGHGDDGRLLRTANWLLKALESERNTTEFPEPPDNNRRDEHESKL